MTADRNASGEYDGPAIASFLAAFVPATDSYPVSAPETDVVPPMRAAWDALKVAETAWSTALQAHIDAQSSLGLADRLEASQRAAEQCAAAAARAAAAGLHFQPLTGPAAKDKLPGELHESVRPSHPDGWPGLDVAAQVLAAAFRQDPARVPRTQASPDGDPVLHGIAEALAFIAQAFGYLAHQVRHGAQ